MATSNDQTAIPMHKRIAMGEKLDGTSMQPKGQSQGSKSSGGGLGHIKAKNK